MDRKFVELNLKVWKVSVLEPGLKEFCFKLLYGRLYLNLALSHFTETSAGCTFCEIRKRRELRQRGVLAGTLDYEREMEQIEQETVGHLFWSCREVHNVITAFINEIAGTNGEMVVARKYWEGCEYDNNSDWMVSIMIVRFIQYSIYRCRLRKRLPLIVNLREDVTEYVRQLGRRAKWVNSLQRINIICHGLLE
jgi:hypothetical protein